MAILGELVYALGLFINAICFILTALLIARVVVSWLPVDPYHSIVLFLVQATDPILAPFRRIPLRIGLFDLSPLLALFAIHLVKRIVVVQILFKLAYQMGAG
jgi:YggT family protein